MRNSGRICDRGMILQQVWGYSFDPGTNIVEVYMRRIRDKVDDGFSVRLLQTVRGKGYMMRVDQ